MEIFSRLPRTETELREWLNTLIEVLYHDPEHKLTTPEQKFEVTKGKTERQYLIQFIIDLSIEKNQ